MVRNFNKHKAKWLKLCFFWFHIFLVLFFVFVLFCLVIFFNRYSVCWFYVSPDFLELYYFSEWVFFDFQLLFSLSFSAQNSVKKKLFSNLLLAKLNNIF